MSSWLRISCIVALLIVVAHCAGCAVTPQEGAWQALAAIDTEQTITIVHANECLYEKDRAAAFLYGSQRPSAGRVLSINALIAVLHFYLADWLEEHDWRTAQYVFYGLSFAYSGEAVIHNARKGIKPAAGFPCRTSTGSH